MTTSAGIGLVVPPTLVNDPADATLPFSSFVSDDQLVSYFTREGFGARNAAFQIEPRNGERLAEHSSVYVAVKTGASL